MAETCESCKSAATCLCSECGAELCAQHGEKHQAVACTGGATMPDRAIFAANLRMIQSALDLMAKDIDNLGELAFDITHDERCDQTGCYASNVLRGSQALPREMEGIVAGTGKKKGRAR